MDRSLIVNTTHAKDHTLVAIIIEIGLRKDYALVLPEEPVSVRKRAI